jgi:hypothetical protein
MTLVNWSTLLPPQATVTFSALRIPDHRDSLDDDIAEIVVDGWYIDVEWNDSKKQYYVTMFRNEIRSFRARIACATPHDVIEAVQALIVELRSPVTYRSAAVTKDTTMSVDYATITGLALATCR